MDDSNQCEKCKSILTDRYGSGRFCSVKCARSFSTSFCRSKINERIAASLKGKSSSRKGIELVQRIERTCSCGKIFRVTPSKVYQKHCSRSCPNLYESYSAATKAAFKNGSKVVTGGRTPWLLYKNIHVQGTFELRTCVILDNWKEHGRIQDWAYASKRISYVREDGTEHTYIIDFQVIENDGNHRFIETKGFKCKNDERKWEAAKKLGLIFEVWFLDDIQKYEAALT